MVEDKKVALPNLGLGEVGSIPTYHTFYINLSPLFFVTNPISSPPLPRLALLTWVREGVSLGQKGVSIGLRG